MDKSKLEAKLEQAQTKRNTIFADIESLQSNEKAADKEIEGIKADLKALDKPELRHGDYGIGNHCERIALHCKDGKGLTQGGCDNFPCDDDYLKPEDVLGNIFADLAAISKPLVDFKVESDSTVGGTGVFTLRVGGDGRKWITCTNFPFSIDGLTEIHRKLGRVITTLKSK